MNKPDDIRMVYGNPITMNHEIGEAKLVKKLSEQKSLEYWAVRFLNEPNIERDAFIRKDGKRK